MVCFCKNTLSQLELALPSLNASASLDISLDVEASAHLQLIASWLAQFGLPAAPWEPDEAWLELTLPSVQLSASAVATLQAFAQLQVLALSLGLDLTVQAQATAFARLVATVEARLSAMLSAGLSVNASAWAQLSAQLHASAQAEAALSLGLLPQPPPMGPPLAIWRGFLVQLRALLPVISVATQLKLDLSADLSVQLAPMLRAILAIPMPAMSATVSLMASLTAGLSAVAQLQLALGINPLEVGLAQVQLMVSERVSAAAAMVEEVTGMAMIELVAQLPRIEYCATLMANPATVNAAMSLNLPSLSWQVPALETLPVLSVGLPVAAFSAQLSAAMNLNAALSPCAGCDAQSLLSSLSVSI